MTITVDVQFPGTNDAPTGGGVNSTTAIFPAGFGLFTALPLDIVVIDIFLARADADGAAASVTSITNTPNITGWTRRRQRQMHGGASSYWCDFERWYGFAANPLNDESPIVNFNVNVAESTCILYALNGVNQSTPWDVNANSSKENFNTTFATMQNTGISTTNPNCAILSACCVPDHVNVTDAVTNGVNVGVIQWIVNTFGPLPRNSSMSVANPLITSSVLSNASASMDGVPNGFIIFADALQAAGGGSALDAAATMAGGGLLSASGVASGIVPPELMGQVWMG